MGKRTAQLEVRFLGATGTITGSKFLLTYRGNQILLDCGLFQGLKELRLRNWSSLLLDVKDLGAVVLTHALEEAEARKENGYGRVYSE